MGVWVVILGVWESYVSPNPALLVSLWVRVLDVSKGYFLRPRH